MRRKYETEAENLAKAIDIAIEAFNKYYKYLFNAEQLTHIVQLYLEWKNYALYPEPKYKNLNSLKYIVQDVFTIFQEDSGKGVEYFWKRIKEEKLPFERKNLLKKILSKKKIKDEVEYDYVIDTMMPFYDEGLINEDELKLLNQLIADFEQKHASK